MRVKLTVVLLLTLCAFVRAESRLVMISIDGLRPDLALRADMPNLRSLMKQGSFTFWATTTPMANTLPSHTSMMTGVVIEKHGINGNNDEAAAKQKIQVPTIFDLAKQAKLSTGMAAGKSKFSIYAKSIDTFWAPAKGSATADEVATQAIEIITGKKPQLMYVHFPQVDGAGHSKGWGSREQMEAIELTDKALGRVLKHLEESKLIEDTTIMVSADHGGTAKTHGGLDPRSQFIPWIIAGPGVVGNLDLAQFKDLKVQTYDTFATACHVLNLPLPQGIDGVPVLHAFKDTNLLSAPAATQPASTAPAVPLTPPAKPAQPAGLSLSPATAPVQ